LRWSGAAPHCVAAAANEKPKGETIAYQTLLDACKAGKVR